MSTTPRELLAGMMRPSHHGGNATRETQRLTVEWQPAAGTKEPKMEWSNEMGSRGRRAWALLVAGGKVVAFTGESIPGVVAVLGSSYHKNGKWSHDTFRLELAAGVRAITGKDGWEQGTFAEGLASALHLPPIDRWGDMANALGVSVPEAERFLREWRPRAADALDTAEAALESVDAAADGGASEVSISFGSPTNRQISAGFWEAPVVVVDGADVEVGRVTPDGSWDRPVCSGPVAVLANEASSGMHGGYRSLRLAVPDGCTAVHGEPFRAPLPDRALAAPPPSPSVGSGAFAAAFRKAGVQ